MFDHVTIGVTDIERSKRFYDQALRPLGIGCLYDDPDTGAVGYGIGDKAIFWLTPKDAPQTSVHIAFGVGGRDIVYAFYGAAIAGGGTDNGPPGLRAHYHEDYFAAFVLDPDGHNIEAVCNLPAE